MNWYKKSQSELTEEVFFDSIHWYDSYYDLYPGYSKPIGESEEYYYDSKEKAEDSAFFVLSIFNDLPDSFPIYRVINSTDNRIDFEYPGMHWSLFEENAKQFGSSFSSPVLLTATIDKSNVDFGRTLANFNEFTSLSSFDDEWEITVDDETKLRDITAVRIRK